MYKVMAILGGLAAASLLASGLWGWAILAGCGAIGNAVAGSIDGDDDTDD